MLFWPRAHGDPRHPIDRRGQPGAMARLVRTLLGAVLLCVAISGASAADSSLSLALGKATRLLVERAFETVIIGDPLIVDVRIDDDRSLVIDPLNPGVTNIILVDAGGVVTGNIRVLVCAASSNACDGGPSSAGSDPANPALIRREVRAQLRARSRGSGSRKVVAIFVEAVA